MCSLLEEGPFGHCCFTAVLHSVMPISASMILKCWRLADLTHNWIFSQDKKDIVAVNKKEQSMLVLHVRVIMEHEAT